MCYVRNLFVLVMFLLTGTVFAQDPPWLVAVKSQESVQEDATQETPEAAPAEVEQEAEVVESPQPTPAPEAQSLVDELLAAAREAREAASEARDAAQESREAAFVAKESVAVVKSFSALSIDDVNEAIRKALEEKPIYTESEIREFAKDEIKKHLEAKVRMPDGSVKTIKSSDIQVTVSGQSGTFSVPPGGVVTEVDGKPVSGSIGKVETPNGVVYMAKTPNYFLQSDPVPRQGVNSAPRVIKFFQSAPSRCANGKCN